MRLSDHTLLINIVIGLVNIKHWNTAFRDLKYEVVAIEPIIPLENSKNSNPDIILYSQLYKHAIILDCKSKTLKEEQTQKYLKLKETPNKLITYGYVSNETDIMCDISFISFHNLENHEVVKSNSIPIMKVIRNERIIEKICKHGNFDFVKLNEIFPIQINSYIPYFIYPFDIEDMDKFRDHILQKLLVYAYKDRLSFTIDELLLDIFGELWSNNIIHNEKKREFKNKARDILKLLRDTSLKNYLTNARHSKSKSLWNINIKDKNRSLQSFVEKCNKAQFGMDTTLDDF